MLGLKGQEPCEARAPFPLIFLVRHPALSLCRALQCCICWRGASAHTWGELFYVSAPVFAAAVQRHSLMALEAKVTCVFDHMEFEHQRERERVLG